MVVAGCVRGLSASNEKVVSAGGVGGRMCVHTPQVSSQMPLILCVDFYMRIGCTRSLACEINEVLRKGVGGGFPTPLRAGCYIRIISYLSPGPFVNVIKNFSATLPERYFDIENASA